MTTYGTIPTTHLPNSSTTTPRSLSLRPWKDLLSLSSLSFPSSLNDAFSRISTNVFFFRMNYAIIMLLILFLSLLWHPVSLIVFIVMMGAWLFLYFMREDGLVLFGKRVDDRVVVVGLGVLTVGLLFLTDATVNIVVALVVGAVVVVAHAAVRKTEDLGVGMGVEFDDEVGGGVAYRGVRGQRMPLKDTASSSFSS